MSSQTMQPTPSGLSETGYLERNLATLDRVDPALAERLRQPVDGSKVCVQSDGRVFYLLHRQWLRLDVSDPEDFARKAIQEVPPEKDVLLLGIGSGELAYHLSNQRERVLAWDPDPWHLRLTLQRFDLVQALNAGKLRLMLGTDLLELTGIELAEIDHPLLAGLHRSAIELRRNPKPGPRVMLAAGGLFVDEVRASFDRRNWCSWTVDVQGLARPELEHQVRRFRPSILFAVNYTEGLAEFAEAHGMSLVCWEVDPALGPPRPTSADSARVVTYRQENADAYRAAGFRNVELEHLAADPDLRRPLKLTADEKERYSAGVGFVGSSLRANAEKLRERTLALWTAHLGGGEENAANAREGFERVLADQRASRSKNVLAEALEREVPGLAAILASRGLDLCVLVGESAASERRLRIIAGLGEFGVSVWGDSGWDQITGDGVIWRGLAGHRDELTRIYNAVTISVDVGRLYQNDIVPMRVFDILSCGGFLIAERNAALADAFSLGEELESWTSLEELRYKVAYYRERPEDARAIAERGREAVLKRHTIDHRLDRMLAGLG